MTQFLKWAPGIALGLALVAYANSIPGAFHLDDFHVVERNVHIRSLDNVPRFFTDTTTFSDLPANRDFRPLLLTTYAVIYRLAGLSPAAFSAWSVLLHAAVVCLVFYLVRGMLLWAPSEELEVPTRRAAHTGGFVAAALFAVHTLGSESVNYTNGQAVLLVTFCYLLATWAYARHLVGIERREGTGRRGALVALALVAQIGAVCSKPTAVTLPVMLGLYDFMFGPQVAAGFRRRLRGVLGRLWPFIAVNIAYLAWRQVVMEAPFGGESPRSYAANAFVQAQVLVFYYLKRFLWPAGLSVDPAFTGVEGASTPAWLAIGALAALFLAAWLVRKRYGLFLYSLLWFVVTLLPVSFLKPLYQIVNEHRMYLPMLGLLVPVAAGLSAVLSRESPRWLPRAGWAVLAVAVLALLGATHLRNQVWQSELTLWEDAAQKSGEWRPHMNYALALEGAGRADQALAEFEAAVEAGAYARPRINLGLAYLRRGRADEGVQEIERGVAQWPALAEGHYYLGYAYESTGNWQGAVEEYARTLELAPTFLHAYYRWAQMEKQAGNLDKARALYNEVLRVAPGDKEATQQLQTLDEPATGAGPVPRSLKGTVRPGGP